MEEKLTVSIIGAGNIAGGFDEKKLDDKSGIFTHAGAYNESGNFILKNIFDLNNQRAKEFKKYWNVKNIVKSEENITNSYQDIISICSPDQFHFQTIKKILLNNSCKTIFVEKPLGLTLKEVEEIYQLSQKSDINIVVNFQRHFDNSFENIKLISNEILSVNCYYIKGLNHIGITMVDTLLMLLGYPISVYSYSRHYNKQINDYTYEFILFYKNFNITIKTIDTDRKYNYHIFDIDILTNNGRQVFTDNGTSFIKYNLDNYEYTGVKVLGKNPIKKETNFNTSMLKSIEYVYNITNNQRIHNINTVIASYNNHLLLDKIIESYKKEKKLIIEETLWKR